MGNVGGFAQSAAQKERGKTVKPIDRIMKDNVPGYSYIAKGAARAVSEAREPKTPRQKKPVQLTEIGKSGKAVLEKYGIPFAYEVLTENIIDRKGTDICPMEKVVWHTDDLDQAYLLLQQRWAELAEEKTAI